MRVIVNDTSCLIDLRKAQLLTSALLLPYRFQVPLPLVAEELVQFSPAEIEDLQARGLEVIDLTGDEVGRAFELRRLHGSLSINDCFSMALAEREDATILLTGDAELRRRAAGAGLEVHGVLWVTDEMEKHGVSPLADVLRGLEHLHIDPLVFLPAGELALRLRRLRAALGV